MPANKTNARGAKAGGSTKKKASARQHAAQRMSRTSHVGGTRRVPAGNKTASQSRFPGETPLTGEDRPSTRPGMKQHGYRMDAFPRRGAKTDTHPQFKAPPIKRRGRES